MNMKRMLAAIALICLAAGNSRAAKTETFCTIDSAADRFLAAAQIPSRMRQDERVRDMARELVFKKLAEKPGEPVRITWADVFNLRGYTQHLLCHGDGNVLNCLGSFIDATGAGLTGSKMGKGLMTVTVLTGPPGFILSLGMGLTEETFQCTPNVATMLAYTGVSFSFYLPVCKTPGVSQACVTVANGVQKGVSQAITRVFGPKTLEAAKVAGVTMQNEGGDKIVKVLLAPIKGQFKTDTSRKISDVSKSIGSSPVFNGVQNAGEISMDGVPVPYY